MSQDYGLRISQSGYDVKTDTDSHMVFSSKFNTLKFLLTGSVQIIIPTNTGVNSGFNATFNHNLGFVPAFLVYPNDGSGGTNTSIGNIPQDLYPNVTYYGTVVDNCQFDYDLTSTYIKFYLRTYDTAGTINGQVTGAHFWPNGSQLQINFKYYIFTQQIG